MNAEEIARKVEENRKLALERLKQRLERIQRQAVDPSGLPVAMPQKDQLAKSNEFSTKRSLNDQNQQTSGPSLSAPKNPKVDVRIITQLESPTSFSIPKCPSLHKTFHQVEEAKYLYDEGVWRFPLSQYEHLCNRTIVTFGLGGAN